MTNIVRIFLLWSLNIVDCCPRNRKMVDYATLIFYRAVTFARIVACILENIVLRVTFILIEIIDERLHL